MGTSLLIVCAAPAVLCVALLRVAASLNREPMGWSWLPSLLPVFNILLASVLAWALAAQCLERLDRRVRGRPRVLVD
jgi:hypothetical protein